MHPEYQQVEIIADSICAGKVLKRQRIITVKLTYWRAIHAEMMTYRMWSRNCSSSRAIPVSKTLEKIQEQDILPIHFGKAQKGMSASREVEPGIKKKAIEIIHDLKFKTAQAAEELLNLGLHKQVVNRYLEPFSTITMLVSSTDWTNFFQQRISDQAQPEIRSLAEEMLDKFSSHEPKRLSPGEYHLPFVKPELDGNYGLKDKIIDSVARCARVSYLNFDGTNSFAENKRLFQKLYDANPKHFTPFEHVCVAKGDGIAYANFTGFMSYRYAIENNLKF
jgi:hypothetical protein